MRVGVRGQSGSDTEVSLERWGYWNLKIYIYMWDGSRLELQMECTLEWETRMGVV